MVALELGNLSVVVRIALSPSLRRARGDRPTLRLGGTPRPTKWPRQARPLPGRSHGRAGGGVVGSRAAVRSAWLSNLLSSRRGCATIRRTSASPRAPSAHGRAHTGGYMKRPSRRMRSGRARSAVSAVRRRLPPPTGTARRSHHRLARDYCFLLYGELGGGTVYFLTSSSRRRMSAFCSSVSPLLSELEKTVLVLCTIYSTCN